VGEFHTGTCFGEAWLRKSGGGAVATLMSTISQPWNPPMVGQDYCNDLLTGGYNYGTNPGNGTSTSAGKNYLGEIIQNAFCLALAESSDASSLNTFATWTLFGDAALRVVGGVTPPSTYSLTVNSGSGGGNFPAGKVVTITANAAPAGQVFSKWVLNSGSPTIANLNASTTTLTMPAGAVSVTATYVSNNNGGPTGYTRCAYENGSYTFTTKVDVAYGANGKFAYKSGVTGTITFNNATFGDPIPGVYKAGYYKASNDNAIYYYIRARHSGKVLDVSGVSTAAGANVWQWTYVGADNQKWQLQNAGNGYYYLKAKHSGMYLDVAGSSTANGGNVLQWPFHGGDNQQWQIQNAGNGYYYLKAKHSGKYLDVSGISTADGANVYQWSFTGASNQQWNIVKTN
jgi:hypothetical protein